MASSLYDDDPAPPYEPSIRSFSTAITTSTRAAPTHTTADTRPAPALSLFHANAAAVDPKTLPAALTSARADRVAELCTEHIDPTLRASAAAGLSTTTLVLVPAPEATARSDLVAADDEALVSEEVIGLPASAHPQLIRLRSTAQGLRFWSQPAAVQELGATLKARLAAGGHRIYAPREVVVVVPPPALASPPAQPKKRGGFFSSRKTEPEPAPPARGMPESGERRIELQDYPLEPGEVKVGVELKEVAVRVETDMGLYDTRSGKAVVVTVELG